MLRKLIAAIRRFFSRRAARKLLAQQLPRGLPAPTRPFRLALRVPPALDPPPGEFWTLPLGAQTVRGRAPARLLRFAALPKPLQRLDKLRVPQEPAPLCSPPLEPGLMPLPEPAQSTVVDLGVARPSNFRLDAELRLPPEVDPLRLPSDAKPPAPVRHVRPRTPLARAPIWRLRPRNFRVDARTLQPANEGIVPLGPRDPSYRWLLPAFRSRFLDLPWMARERIAFLAPLQPEWFSMWWLQSVDHQPGGKNPLKYKLTWIVWSWLNEVKEQMLIRRDVKKDEKAPAVPELLKETIGLPIASHQPQTRLAAHIPEKEWVEPAEMPPPFELENDLREAVLQWRTLMNALEER